MKTKQKKTYRVTYLGCEGTGATRTEAKQNAMQRIQRVFDTAQSPTIISWRGHLAILWRNLDCWEYTILDASNPTDQEGWVRYGLSVRGDCSFTDIVNDVSNHLAQIGWTHADGKTIPFVMKGCSEARQKDFLYWARWQLAAYHARHVLGMTDSNAIHRWACENDTNF